MATISNLVVKITSDKAKFDRDLIAVKSSVADMEKGAVKATSAVKGLTVAFAALGGAAVIRSAISLTVDFNQAIADLSAITGAAGKDLEFYRKQAEEIGKTTSLSASQAAAAFKLIASAKPDLLSSAEALNAVTREAVTLAEATGQELPVAAKALGSALNQFQLDASKANEVINILAASSKLGTVEVDLVTEALRSAGPAANALGIDLAETVAVIQGFAKAGIVGANAGEKMKQVLFKLEKQNNSQLKPSIVGINVALQNLAKQNRSVSGLMELFGEESAGAAAAILAQVETVNQLNTSLRGTSIATEQATTRMDTFKGDVLKLKSAIEGLAIGTLGGNFDDLGRSLVQLSTEGVNSLNENLDTLKDISAAVAIIVGSRMVGSFATARAAQLSYASAVATGKAVTLGSAQAELQKATALQASSVASLKKAQSEQASTAAEVANWKAVVQSIQAEIELETIRLKSQITAQGRIASINRLAAARLELVAATRGLSAAEAQNAASAASVATASNIATVSQTRLSAATAATGLVARTTAASIGALKTAVSFLGGPVGVLTLAAGALLLWKTNAGKAATSTDTLTLSINDLTAAQARQRLLQNQPAFEKAKEDAAIYAARIEFLRVQLQRFPTKTSIQESLINAEANFDTANQVIEKHIKLQGQLKNIVDGKKPAAAPAVVKTKEEVSKLQDAVDNLANSEAWKSLFGAEDITARSNQFDKYAKLAKANIESNSQYAAGDIKTLKSILETAKNNGGMGFSNNNIFEKLDLTGMAEVVKGLEAMQAKSVASGTASEQILPKLIETNTQNSETVKKLLEQQVSQPSRKIELKMTTNEGEVVAVVMASAEVEAKIAEVAAKQTNNATRQAVN